MVDIDGSFKYSEVPKVDTECSDRITEMELFPNPLSTNLDDLLNIKLFADLDQDKTTEFVDLIISDQLGREVIKKSIQIVDG